MATAAERRLKVRNAYRKYIGRNHYSNARRDYCTKPYNYGKYYSDCSSSVSYAYKEAGEGFGILNTVGMWNSKKLVDVPVIIKNGVIQNPEVLRIGDMLLFAGNDVGRKSAGYVGHVEMVGEISGTIVQLYGHGSGLAKKHEMNAYCRSRYNTKSVTPLKRRLLIRVRRMIQDDATGGQDDTSSGAGTQSPVDGRACVVVTGGTVNVRSGPGTDYKKLGTVKKGDRLVYDEEVHQVNGTDWYLIEYLEPGEVAPINAWISGKYAKLGQDEAIGSRQ